MLTLRAHCDGDRAVTSQLCTMCAYIVRRSRRHFPTVFDNCVRILTINLSPCSCAETLCAQIAMSIVVSLCGCAQRLCAHIAATIAPPLYSCAQKLPAPIVMKLCPNSLRTHCDDRRAFIVQVCSNNARTLRCRSHRHVAAVLKHFTSTLR